MTTIRNRARTLIIALLVGVIALGAGIAVAHSDGTEIRITAMRLDDGRIEFAVQEREGEGWGERILPSSRFFPASGREGRWLNSTPITVGVVEELETATATPTATSTTSTTATPGFAISGSGSDVQTVTASGQLACRASVTGNANRTYSSIAANFIVTIHGSNSQELLANEISVATSVAKVVTFGGTYWLALQPPYRVEVQATGEWDVSCAP